VFRSDDGGQSFVRKSTGMFVECDVRALVVHPADPRVILAGTNEGLYRTNDGGEHWVRIESPMNRMVIWSILIDPDQPDTIIAGTRPAHIFRSADAGRNWSHVARSMRQDCNNLIFNRVTTLIRDPLEPETMWAGVEIDGVWVSRDRGETWGPVSDGLSSLDIHCLVVVPSASGKRIVASTNNDLNSLESGDTVWVPHHFAGKFERPYFRGIAQNAADLNQLLVGNGNAPPGSVGTIFRSVDGGATWVEAKMPGVANSTIWGFATHGSNPNRVYAYSVSGELYRSVDAGLVWSKLDREFGEIRSLAWAPF